MSVNTDEPLEKKTKMAIDDDDDDDGFVRIYTPKTLPLVTQRYYQRYTFTKDGVKVAVLRHSNGICVVFLDDVRGLLANHCCPSERFDTLHVDFQVTEKSNRLDSRPKGKSKKGGQFLQDEKATLCRINFNADEDKTPVSINIPSGVPGKLISVNAGLDMKPSMLLDNSVSGHLNSWIGIIIPKQGYDFSKHLTNDSN